MSASPADFFSYELPSDRIAQEPVSKNGGRANSRLLHAAKRSSLEVSDLRFADLPDLLAADDVLVLNDSRVLPWRFFPEINGAESEVLLIGRAPHSSGVWHALARPMRKFKAGDKFVLSPQVSAEVIGRTPCGAKLELALSCEEEIDLEAALEAGGSMPIPGYIRRGRPEEWDKQCYQTIFARNPGSIAAPTAGLHFTPELLERLKQKGIAVMYLTLHVGPASFQPVQDFHTHRMPSERFSICPDVLRHICEAKAQGRKVAAVGTTSTRVLESIFHGKYFERDGDCETDLFIRPGFEFLCVDKLITNFHQPHTTHLQLVAAFIGEGETERIYSHALSGAYRFLSYGDSMLLEK